MTQMHQAAAGHRIAYRRLEGEAGSVGVVFLCGFRSDMESTKATALWEFCEQRNIPFTCFDYFAHGKSEGEFIDYTINRGLEDTLEILDHIANGPQILVGSSMGGWIGMQAGLQRKGQVLGFVGIAAAPDFTERMPGKMNAQQQEDYARDGVAWAHSEYFGNDYPVTRKLIESARELLLMEHPIPLDIPVHLLQGHQDEDVPWTTANAIAERLLSEDVVISFIKDGDHRLNRPQDLQLLLDAVARMRGLAQG